MGENVRGRAVLVTGAARGIGQAIARRFAAAGDRVAILDKVQAALAGDLVAGLDAAANNAVIFVAHPSSEGDYATWQKHWDLTLGVNLIGASYVTWCAFKH